MASDIGPDFVLTFEFSPDTRELHIVGDAEGLEVLRSEITSVLKTQDHTHLMTPEWGGPELSSRNQINDTEILNKVNVIFVDAARE